jgi:hypothetical protein
MRMFLLAVAGACFFSSHLAAQDNTELLNRMKAMEDRIKSLEAEVADLMAKQAATAPVSQASPAAQAAIAASPAAQVAPPAQAAPPTIPPASPAVVPPQQLAQAPIAAPQLGGAGVAAAKALNPDISMIGDFVGGIGNPGNRPTPSLQMHESELGLQAIIDPYARGDFFLTFGEEGVGLEEGYITFTSLPAGLQVKAGKMRAAFGKVNTMHNHVLPWVDRPLVTQNLVGGEDGIDDAGFSLSRILPAPKGIFLEGTAQIYRGDTPNVFRAYRRSDLGTVEHLRFYRDITDNTNVDLGGSFARGYSPFGNGWNQLDGFDATLRWKPLQRAVYNSFIARSELIWARTVAGTVGRENIIRKPFGFYVSGDYQVRQRWFLGGRFDRSQRVACLPTDPETVMPEYCGTGMPVLGPLLQDTGGSILLTYWPSEFSQIRGQLRRTRYGEGFTANELLFQFIFSLGAHGAHPF